MILPMLRMLIRPLVRICGLYDSGSAAVEFAISAPILVVLALGIADYGALMTNAASLEGATRAIAEYARNSPACNKTGNTSWLTDSSCVTGISNLATTLQSNDTSLSSATFAPLVPQATPANYCTCSDGSSVSCSSTSCALSDPRVVQYIRISATQTFSPLFAVIDVPGLFSTTLVPPSSLSAQTTIRIQ